MKYFSSFAGIGGFELGIERAIHDILLSKERQYQKKDSKGNRKRRMESDKTTRLGCIGYSEIDKYAIQIYEKHFKGHKNYGDITKIDTGTIPDFDLFVGGFPCQSFSIAGKRRGFADTRGTLFFEIARILNDKRPRYFVLENVKGLLSHDEGNTFKVIIATLDELGYFVEWQVLNSKNFGVPQNRERVFIIGHLGGNGRPKVFPIGKNDKTFNGKSGAKQPLPQTTVSRAIKGNEIKADSTFIVGGLQEHQSPRKDNISPCLPEAMGKGGGHTPLIGTLRTHKDGKGFRKINSGISPTIPARAREDGSGQPVIYSRSHGFNRGGKKDVPNLRLSTIQNELIIEDFYPNRVRTSDNSPTLRGDRQGLKVSNNMQIRRLTPIECERLQGFPDNWTDCVSDTQRYKVLGNAVTVNVIEFIMRKLFNDEFL